MTALARINCALHGQWAQEMNVLGPASRHLVRFAAESNGCMRFFGNGRLDNARQWAQMMGRMAG